MKVKKQWETYEAGKSTWRIATDQGDHVAEGICIKVDEDNE